MSPGPQAAGRARGDGAQPAQPPLRGAGQRERGPGPHRGRPRRHRGARRHRQDAARPAHGRPQAEPHGLRLLQGEGYAEEEGRDSADEKSCRGEGTAHVTESGKDTATQSWRLTVREKVRVRYGYL